MNNSTEQPTNAQILRVAMRQSAIDAGCAPEDFKRHKNIVVISRPHDNARRYLQLPFFCNLVTYGGNIVASVDERVIDFVRRYIDQPDPYRCFCPPQTRLLSDELKKYGYNIGFAAEYWLPDIAAMRAHPCDYATRALERAEFAALYLPEWHNALCESRKQLDVLAVGAYDGERLIGLAGCSADCVDMWQIGVDVLPEYRLRGIASALTSRLAIEVFKRGRVPFYCCAWSNLASARNAARSGFRPAWIELTAMKAALPDPNETQAFWAAIDALIAESELIIDRPRGVKHPRFDYAYPLDYGYLNNTASMDGGGIDVWRGSLPDKRCDAIICTVDLMKRDSEIKLLIGLTDAEKVEVLRFHNESSLMKGVMITRTPGAH